MDIEYKIIKPGLTLSDFVERLWVLNNRSEHDKEIVVIPDGRIDILFTRSAKVPFQIALLGVETKPSSHTFPAKTILFGVSLKLLAIEYLLHQSISNILNTSRLLPDDFWGISVDDLNDL